MGNLIKNIELRRIETKLTECMHVLETSIYAGQQAAAEDTIKHLQERYKEISGEYAVGYMLTENLNDTEPNETIGAIVDKVISDIDNFGPDGYVALLNGIASLYETDADELTNMDAKGIAKHLRDAVDLLKKRTSN